MENAFHGATNMRMSATDAPDLSAVRTILFRDASLTVIGGWDVGKVTDVPRCRRRL